MENFKHIVVATDFSENAKTAAYWGKNLASLYGSNLTLLHVFNPKGPRLPSPYYMDGKLHKWLHEEIDTMYETAEEYLKKLTLFCSTEKQKCLHCLISGNPREEIVRFTQSSNVDLLILGSHGYTSWEKCMLGTTTDYVLRRASCTVFIAKSAK